MLLFHMTLLFKAGMKRGGRGLRVSAIKGVESVDTCGRLGRADRRLPASLLGVRHIFVTCVPKRYKREGECVCVCVWVCAAYIVQFILMPHASGAAFNAKRVELISWHFYAPLPPLLSLSPLPYVPVRASISPFSGHALRKLRALGLVPAVRSFIFWTILRGN